MKNRNTYLIIICVVILLAGGIYYFIKDEPSVPPPAAQVTKEEVLPSFVGSSIVEEHDGKKLWELSAEKIEVDTNSKVLRFANLKGVFYQDNGGKIDITSPVAIMDNETRNVTMSGGVKATASDGAAFSAKDVKWLAAERLIKGTGDVVLTRDDAVITGDSIESDNNLEKVKIQGNARVRKGGL